MLFKDSKKALTIVILLLLAAISACTNRSDVNSLLPYYKWDLDENVAIEYEMSSDYSKFVPEFPKTIRVLRNNSLIMEGRFAVAHAGYNNVELKVHNKYSSILMLTDYNRPSSRILIDFDTGTIVDENVVKNLNKNTGIIVTGLPDSVIDSIDCAECWIDILPTLVEHRAQKKVKEYN